MLNLANQVTKSMDITTDVHDHFTNKVSFELTKSGYKTDIVSDAGLDIVAIDANGKTIGVVVRGRVRTGDRISSRVDFKKNVLINAMSTVEKYGLDEIYFAICVEEEGTTRIFFTTMFHLLDDYGSSSDTIYWNMSQNALAGYYADPKVQIIESNSTVVSAKLSALVVGVSA